MDQCLWTDEVWTPVGIKGFGLDYEMCPLGFVRRVVRGAGAARRFWLLPLEDAAGDGEPLYRLCAAGARAELRVADIFRLFGVRAEADAAWLARARTRALAENALAHGAVYACESLRSAVQDGAEVDMEMLALTIEHGCPWERARMGGDARGADPVLGF
jgi:hypothetical protein